MNMVDVTSDTEVEQLRAAVYGLASAVAKLEDILPHIVDAERLAHIGTLFEHLRVEENLIVLEKVSQNAPLFKRPTLRLVSSRESYSPGSSY